MEQYVLNAESRNERGKGANRRLRRAGKLPGIVYGADQEARSILLDHALLLRQSENEAFFSRILTINMDGKSEKVVLKDLQRHPYKPVLMHIDFQRINENEELTMRVPIHFTNEDRCVGVKTGGGVVSHILSELEISCLPKDLPEYIEIDLSELNVGDTVHLGDIKLPAGVTIYALKHGGDVSQPVVSVHIPKAIEVEEEAPAEGAEAAAAAAPAGEAAAEPKAPGSAE